ncbi:MAG: exosortase/archaeosortase family protein [Chthoniobacterales bacterium]
MAGFVMPALLWLWLCWNLHYEWSLNAQYNYGWAVPLLALFLFHARWTVRPRRSPVPSRAVITAASIVLLALLLPIRLIEEANPDWRLLSWVFALVVVAYSLLQLARRGGVSWVRHFAFPVCFALIAVPWPVLLENAVVQTLTRTVAAVAVEIASWLGLGAYQLGNIIQLRNGFVGVDEACSGVRTLQTAIMVSLFLGELLRMTAARRVLFVVISCAWVFACNVARATTLVSIAGSRGMDALHDAHDTVGTIVLIAGLAGIAATGWLLHRPRTLGEAASAGVSFRLRWVEVGAGLIWLGVIFAATEIWYRVHEQRLLARPAWRAEWPPNATSSPIADSTRTMLRYDEASSATWRTSSAQCWGFFARWAPRRTAVQLVRSHSPEICLPATGRTFQGELPPFYLDAVHTSLAFRVYRFEQNAEPLFVFVCIQEDRFAVDNDAQTEWNARGRLLAAWTGRRNLGQHLLELALLGANDVAEAERVASNIVSAIVRSPATD